MSGLLEGWDGQNDWFVRPDRRVRRQRQSLCAVTKHAPGNREPGRISVCGRLVLPAAFPGRQARCCLHCKFDPARRESFPCHAPVAIAPQGEIGVKPRKRWEKTVLYPLVTASTGEFSRAERRQVNDGRRAYRNRDGWNFRPRFRVRQHSAPSFPRFFARASSS